MSMTVSTSMQDMRSTRRAAKECGCAPTLNSGMAFIARRAFKGLTGGLCDPYEEGEIEESTYADVKKCIEHACSRSTRGWFHGWSDQNPHKTFVREKRDGGTCQRRALGV